MTCEKLDHLAEEAFPEQAEQILNQCPADDIDTLGFATALDLQPLITEGLDGGQRSKYDPDPIVRAFLLKELRGMDDIQTLADELSNDQYTAHQLGFDPEETPDRSVLSRWWNDYLSSCARTALSDGSEAVIDCVHDRGIALDSVAYEPEQPDGDSSRTQKRMKEQTRKDVLKNTRSWLHDGIDLHREGSVIYSDSDYLDLMSHLGLESSFANDGAEGFHNEVEKMADEDEPRSPSGDSLIHHLKKFDKGELMELFEELNDQLFQVAEERGLFDEAVDLAIDENAIPYYGDTDHPMVTNMKEKAGTNYGFKYATMCIVGDDGRRFTLGVVPITSQEELRDAVLELIEKAEDYIEIKQIYMDRGYYDARLVEELNKRGHYYVIRAQQTAPSKRLWKNRDEDQDVNFKLGSTIERKQEPYAKASVNRVVAEPISDDDEFVAFITNRPVTEESAEELVEEFRDRWGIETSYRVAADFRAKTTSKSYSVRLFYYLYSHLLYNVYILTNAIVRQALGIPPSDTPPVTAKSVMRELRDLYRPPR